MSINGKKQTVVCFVEINRVRLHLFHQTANKEPLDLPEESGPLVTLAEKLYVPVKDFPEVGAITKHVYTVHLNTNTMNI